MLDEDEDGHFVLAGLVASLRLRAKIACPIVSVPMKRITKARNDVNTRMRHSHHAFFVFSLFRAFVILFSQPGKLFWRES